MIRRPLCSAVALILAILVAGMVSACSMSYGNENGPRGPERAKLDATWPSLFPDLPPLPPLPPIGGRGCP